MNFTCENILDRTSSNCPKFAEMKINLNNKDKKLYLREYYVKCIIETIKFFTDENCDFARELFNDIVNNYKENNGKLYELLMYHWLISRKICFLPQPSIKKEDCFKVLSTNIDSNKTYKADGQIGNAYFDIKTFGITLPHIETLRNELSKKMNGYIITIGGNLNVSNRELKTYALDKINDIIFNLKNKSTYKIPHIDLEIRAVEESEQFATSVSEFDAYEWAKNNQYYFMYHGSQFCNNAPYIIFCVFDSNINHMLSTSRIS